MNSVQYEELCRRFLASRLGIAVGEIGSPRMPNPKREGLSEYAHQIDLYWVSNDPIADYINIANAKWRSSDTDKVDQPDVLLLSKIREKVAAHKAVMITSTSFTSGARAAAEDEGIGLYIVQPRFDIGILPANDRAEIQARLQELGTEETASLLYSEVVHRAFDWSESQTRPRRPASGGYSNRVATPTSNRAVSSPANRAIAPGGNRIIGPGGSATTKG